MKSYTVILTRDTTESVVLHSILAPDPTAAHQIALSLQKSVSGWTVDENIPQEAYVTDVTEDGEPPVPMQKDEVITALFEAVSDDVWYDAEFYGDDVVSDRIKRYQNAMMIAAGMLSLPLTTPTKE